jgi:polyisoprenoid-binding protein YceI
MTVDAATAGAVQTYSLDGAHSSAGFSVRHMMIAKVKGTFSQLSGTLTLDPTHKEDAQVDVDIVVASISTGSPERDAHLKTGDFFELDAYPTIKFVSTRVDIADNGDVRLVGNLTIRGVTKEVTLAVDGTTDEAKDPWGNYRLGFEATTKIKRSDFGLNWNAALETGGWLVGDEVDINIDAQFVRAAS